MATPTGGRPVLHTARLRLDPLTLDHTELLVELDADPDVTRHIFGRALTRDEVLREWMPRRTRADADARGLGYRLPRAAWGRGFATEGARALLDHGFGTVGLARVWADPAEANAESQRVLDKLGFARLEDAEAGVRRYQLRRSGRPERNGS